MLKGIWPKCWTRRLLASRLLEEYRRKALALAERFPQVGSNPFLRWVENECPRFEPHPLGKQRSLDATDDMFLAAALSSGAKYLITRDPDLLALKKPFGVLILSDHQ